MVLFFSRILISNELITSPRGTALSAGPIKVMAHTFDPAQQLFAEPRIYRDGEWRATSAQDKVAWADVP